LRQDNAVFETLVIRLIIWLIVCLK